VAKVKGELCNDWTSANMIRRNVAEARAEAFEAEIEQALTDAAANATPALASGVEDGPTVEVDGDIDAEFNRLVG
jgi:hypothetical protein